MTRPRCRTLAVLALCLANGAVRAEESGWLPVRDQNPFVLGGGLSLLPDSVFHASDWRLDASLSESNSQLLSADARSTVVYAAETRETRLAFAYAVDDAWSARVSLGTFWIGVGFLDKPIQHFHSLIGAPQGYRGGRLGVRPPYVRVDRDGRTLFLLDAPRLGAAPLMADVTRSWTPDERTRLGVNASLAVPLGGALGLQDLGGTGLALSAFGEWLGPGGVEGGARVGYLHESRNDVLPSLARHGVPFADAYARAPLWAGWSATLQYDLHGALYRAVPNFLGYAGILSAGLAHALGARVDFQFVVSEDVPIAHTQDVALTTLLGVHPQ